MNTKQIFLGAAMALAAMTSQAQTTTDVVCSYAPSQSAAVNRITAGVGGAGAGAAAILEATGLTLVAHSSGGYILTGAGGYVAGTLLSPLVVPVLITASVVVAGGVIAVELSCAPKNHPDAINKVKALTAEFSRAVLSANDKAVIIRDNTGKEIRRLNNRAIDVRDAAIIEARDGASQLYARGRTFLNPPTSTAMPIPTLAD